jgi:hypothetical protein
LTAPAHSNPETNKFFEDFGVWKDAPILTGSTKYTPLPDVKNIMITGGAGFMYVIVCTPPTIAFPNQLSMQCMLAGATLDLDIPRCV